MFSKYTRTRCPDCNRQQMATKTLKRMSSKSRTFSHINPNSADKQFQNIKSFKSYIMLVSLFDFTNLGKWGFCSLFPVFLSLTQPPNAGQGRLIFEVSGSHQLHTTVGKNPLDEEFARRRDSTWQDTTLTRDRHPCLQRDSHPQFQKAIGRRPSS